MPKAHVSIIGADLKVVGSINCSGGLRVNGTVEGDIKGSSMAVGESGRIQGSIVADTVNICGSINGQTKADTVTVSKSARITGGITHQSLSIEPGAFLDGVSCKPQS